MMTGAAIVPFMAALAGGWKRKGSRQPVGTPPAPTPVERDAGTLRALCEQMRASLAKVERARNVYRCDAIDTASVVVGRADIDSELCVQNVALQKLHFSVRIGVTGSPTDLEAIRASAYVAAIEAVDEALGGRLAELREVAAS